VIEASQVLAQLLVGIAIGASSIVAAIKYAQWRSAKAFAKAFTERMTPHEAPEGHIRCKTHTWLDMRAATREGVQILKVCEKCRSIEGSEKLAPMGSIESAIAAKEEQDRYTRFLEQDMEEIVKYMQTGLASGKITVEQIKQIYNAGATMDQRFQMASALGIDRDAGKASH